MRPSLPRMSWDAAGVAAAALLTSATVEGAVNVPVISARSYVSGSAKVIVAGSIEITSRKIKSQIRDR